MVRVPTPEEEDRRRICRERKALVAERVLHVNRIKGLLLSQGIQGDQPMHRDRRKRLEELQTDMVGSPAISGRRFAANLTVSSCCSNRSTLWKLSEMPWWPRRRQTPARPWPYWRASKELVRSLRLSWIWKACSDISTIEGRSPPMRVAPSPWQSGTIDREQGVSSGQSAAANDDGPACLAMAASPTRFYADPLVSRTGRT